MNELFNIYCDESCHLEFDKQKAMFIGSIWCKKSEVKFISNNIREIKTKHGYNPDSEMKWVKVSNCNLEFYKEIMNYFLENDSLRFRCVIVSDKSALKHGKYNQTHNDFYYKIYYDMLKMIINPLYSYNIYVDIKDTDSNNKNNELKKVLINKFKDYDNNIIKKIQSVRSTEVELIQLADILLGVISYKIRELTSSKSKLELLNIIESNFPYSFYELTPRSYNKINILYWTPDFFNI